MLVIARFDVDPAGAGGFRDRVEAAVGAMARRPGHVSSRLARALDDVRCWTLVSEWESVGSYRRALSNVEVRMAGMPLMGAVADEPTSYEILWDHETGERSSDHA